MMNRHIITTLFTAASLAALALSAVSCSKAATGKAALSDGQVRVRASIGTGGLAAGSAALGTRKTVTELPLNGVRFAKYNAFSEPTGFVVEQVSQGDIQASGDVVFAKPFYYDKINTFFSSYIMAWYPGLAENASSEVVFDLDGKTDVLYTKAIWNAGSIDAPNTTTNLTLVHALCQLRFVFKAEAGADANAINSTWGKIEKIEMCNVANEMVLRLSDRFFGYQSSADLLMWNSDYSQAFVPMNVPLSDNTAVNAAVMSMNIGQFKITTTKFPEGKMLSLKSTVPQVGESITVTLVFGAGEGKITVADAVVTPWDLTGSGSGDMIAPEPEEPIESFQTIVYGQAPFDNTTNFSGSTNISYNDCWGESVETNGPHSPSYDAAQICASEKPYQKFMVANSDIPAEICEPLTWLEIHATAPGVSFCATQMGEGWRLPRFSELHLIFQNIDKLTQDAKFMPLSGSYSWSATLYGQYAPYMMSNDGYPETYSTASGGYHVRCIKEVH